MEPATSPLHALPRQIRDPLILCDLLRARHGFVIGVEEVDKLTRVLVMASGAGMDLSTAEAAHALLSPVLARGPAEQEILRKELALIYDPAARRRLEDAEWESTQAQQARRRGPTGGGSPERGPTPVWQIAGGVIGFFGALYALYAAITSIGANGTGGEPGQVPQLPGDVPTGGISAQWLEIFARFLSTYFTGTALIFTAAIFAVLVLGVALYLRLRRLWASRDFARTDQERSELRLGEGEALLFRSPGARAAIERITRHLLVETADIDAPASLRATVQAGNRLTVRRRLRKQQPEFLLLFDRYDVDDLMQIALQDMARALARHHIHLRRMDFTLDPSELTEIDAQGAVIRRERFEGMLAAAEAAQVLLVSDPRRLCLPGQESEPQPWLAELARASDLTILSPVPLARLGAGPRALMRRLQAHLVGGAELILSEAPTRSRDGGDRGGGALMASRFLTHAEADLPGESQMLSEVPPSAEQRARLRRWLVSHLSGGAREALAALSMYPEITPPLTRAIGATLKDEAGGSLMTGPRLGEVMGLAWLRHARMPAWARGLVQELVPPERRAVLAAGIEAALEPAGGGGTAQLHLIRDARPRPVGWLGRLLPGGGAPMQEAVLARPGRRDPLAFLLPRAALGGAGWRLNWAQLWRPLVCALIGVAVLWIEQNLVNSFELQFAFPALAALALCWPMLLAMRAAPDWLSRLGNLMIGGMLAYTIFAVVDAARNAALDTEFVQGQSTRLSLLLMTGAWFLRGRPGRGRDFEYILKGSTWLGGVTWVLVLVSLAVWVLSLRGDSNFVFVDVLSTPMIATAIFVILGIALCQRLALPLWHAFVLAALGGGMCVVGSVIGWWIGWAFFPDTALFNVFGYNVVDLGTSFSTGLRSLNGGDLFGTVLCWTLGLAAVSAQIEWHRPEKQWRLAAVPVAGLVLGLALCAGAALIPIGIPLLLGNGDNLILSLGGALAGLPLALFAFFAMIVPNRVGPRPDYGWLWPMLWSFAAWGLIAYFAIQTPSWDWQTVQLSSLYLGLASAIAAPILLRIGMPDLFGRAVWTVFDGFAWNRYATRGIVGPVLIGLAFATVLGFRVNLDIGMSLSLTVLSYPVAVWAGVQYGRAGFWAVAIGALPFLLRAEFFLGVIDVRQVHGIPGYFATLLLARLGAMEGFRRAIYRAGRLTDWQIIFLCLGLSFSVWFAVADNLGINFSPYNYLLVIAFLMGLSKVKQERFRGPLILVILLLMVKAYLVLDLMDVIGFGQMSLSGSVTRISTLLNIAVTFYAGRVIAGLIVRPEPTFTLVQIFRFVVIVWLASLLDFDVQSNYAPLDRLSIWLDSHMAMFWGYIALGYVGGRRGVLGALALDIVLFCGLSAAIGLVSGTFWETSWFRLGIYPMSANMGVFYFTGPMDLSIGNFVLAFVGVVMRRSFDNMAEMRRTKGDTVAHRDYAALTGPAELTRDGFPALRALWIDRYLVIAGIAVLLWVPIFGVLVLVAPETIGLDLQALLSTPDVGLEPVDPSLGVTIEQYQEPGTVDRGGGSLVPEPIELNPPLQQTAPDTGPATKQ